MIPTAQVLADLLNDPAIPAEAKPRDIPGRDWQEQDGGLLGQCDGFVPTSWVDRGRVNVALFWSLSAWLWGRGEDVRVSPTGLDSGFGAGYPIDGGYDSMFAPTPVEALAAVVRQVNAATSAGTPGSPPVAPPSAPSPD